jgi:transglutaminase-like putative cysteine protease
MRFEIDYTSEFKYPEPVWESQNLLRACPITDAHQTLLHYELKTVPAARVHSYSDYWGTRVDAFGARAPHDRLSIHARSAVETRPSGPMAAAPAWKRLSDPGFIEAHLEYLAVSRHTAWNEALRAEAERRAAPAGADIVGAVLSLHRMVGGSLAYIPGSTAVGVDVNDVLRGRKGVCQDFAHLMIAMCRSLCVPARYVSGYLFSEHSDSAHDPETESVRVKTHAWVEVAIPGAGWWGLDPTNRQEVGPRHIKIGHGRDYDDVQPLRGVYFGSGDHKLDVCASIRRGASASQQ